MVFADLMPLFAQAGRFAGPGPGPGAGGPPPGGGPPAGMVAAVLLFYAVVIVIAVVFHYTLLILYSLTVSRCLREIAPRNRTVEPNAVWLALIPCAGFIFQIINDFKLVESVKNEYEDRGWRADGDYGKQWVILYLVGAVVAGPLAVVAFVLLWVKVAKYARQFREDTPERGYIRDDEDDFDDDYRPRRSRRSGDNAPRTVRRDPDDRDDDRPRRRGDPDDRDDDDRDGGYRRRYD